MKIVCFDFDGVIHSNKSGCKDHDFFKEIIPDPPVPGIKEEIDRIREAGYKVVVHSARCETINGALAVRRYLKDHKIVVDDITGKKPHAYVTIDDRVIRFGGKAEGLLEQIERFRTWVQGV